MAAGDGTARPTSKQCQCGAGHLAPRRFEVFTALAEGLRARDIAEVLYVTIHTVNYHIRAIYRLAEVSTRNDLMKVGLAQGLLEITPDATYKTTGKKCIWPRSQWPRPAHRDFR